MTLIKSLPKKMATRVMQNSDDEGAVPLTNFDISDFFEDPSENLDHLIGGGNVCYD